MYFSFSEDIFQNVKLPQISFKANSCKQLITQIIIKILPTNKFLIQHFKSE